MDSLRAVVGGLLAARGVVRNSELARELGVSRQRANVLLKRLVDSDELRLVGYGRGAKYERGRGWGQNTWGVGRGLTPQSFWQSMTEQVPMFCYVALAKVGRSFRTRRDAREIMDSSELHIWTVVDFRGVPKVTPAFAEEVLGIGYSMTSGFVEPINMSPEVESVVAFVLARQERRGISPPTDRIPVW